MRGHKWFVFLWAWIVLSSLAHAASFVEVRSESTVYAQPNKRSQKLLEIDLSNHDGPYSLRLVSDKKVSGYYNVKLAGRNETGWIYKSYVRRFEGQHPKYVPYKRSLYRHWIDEDGNCRNTRNEVLARDSQNVTFKDTDKCEVLSGIWKDPYSGQTFREPRQLDVDHVVPLKNAHESGAWAWSNERRRQYANYLTDRNHLLAVQASENRRKGDKGPDRYVPPNATYRCEYVRAWVKIKEDWGLDMTDDEGAEVQRVLGNCNQ